MESSTNPIEAKIAELPEDKQDMVKKLCEKIEELKSLATEEGWKESTSKGEYVVHTKKTDSGLNCVRGHGPIDFSAKTIFDFLMTSGNTPKYDSQFKEGRVVESIDAELGLEVGYSRYKGTTFVSDRDFCLVSAGYQQEDGSYIIIATSCEHADCPDVKKCVRADLYIGGWVITPNSEDPDNKCSAYYITQSDLKGSIPKMFVNSVSKNQGLLPQSINETLKKE